MNYKIIIYVVAVFLTMFGLTSVNYNGIIKTNKYWESRILIMVLSFSLGYLLGNMIIVFLNI